MIFQDLFVKQKVQKNSICLKHLVALCLNYHFWSNECILAVKKVGYLKKKKNTDPSLPNLKYAWETKSEGKSDWPSCYFAYDVTADEDEYSEKSAAMKTNDTNVWLVDGTVKRKTSCVGRDDTASHQWHWDRHTCPD